MGELEQQGPPRAGERRARGQGGRRALAFCLGLLAALVAVELLLRALDLPRVYERRHVPSQFSFLRDLVDRGEPYYVNTPSARIPFTYDGDPRGYFDPSGRVVHTTNRFGFRGGEFETGEPRGVLRIAFLGDSFTFGEGVRDEDTYPAVVEAVLNGPPPRLGEPVEAYNFGVGGHNTEQTLRVLELAVAPTRPDAIVLGYVLNDAEEPLYEIVPGREKPRRRAREVELDKELWIEPPAGILFRLRSVQLLWRAWHGRGRAARMEEYYCDLFEERNPGWPRSRLALASMGEYARARGTPFYVALFPILHELDGDYPFGTIHAKVRDAAEAAGARFIDFLPVLEGHEATTLWVHPTDQHPNELAHRLVGEALAAAFEHDGLGGAPR